MSALTISELKLAVKTLSYLSRIEQGKPASVYLDAALSYARADLKIAEEHEAVFGRAGGGK